MARAPIRVTHSSLLIPFPPIPRYGQAGALILDNTHGNPVWFRPTGNVNLVNTDFRVQHLNGKPVLTFWQGTIATPPTYTNVPAGSSEPGSCYYILDNTYRVIKTVTAQYGFTSDVHEFLLTPSNTALFLSTKAVPMNLTPYGGPANGYIQDFAIQEIDLNTGRLVFFWDALNYIPLTNSYEPASSATSTGNIWDVYHLNSIGLTDSPTDIVVSGTKPLDDLSHQQADRTDRLAARRQAEQFHVRFGCDILLAARRALSAEQRREHVRRQLLRGPNGPAGHAPVPRALPSAQPVQHDGEPGDAVFSRRRPARRVPGQYADACPMATCSSAGASPQYYSEFAPGGNTDRQSGDEPALQGHDAAHRFGNNNMATNYSYRAYRETWVGTPYYPPVIAAVQGRGQTTIYASWNGATEVKTWQVFAVNGAGLFPVASAAKSGFETAITVPGPGGYFQAKALDAHGTVIGVSGVALSR